MRRDKIVEEGNPLDLVDHKNSTLYKILVEDDIRTVRTLENKIEKNQEKFLKFLNDNLFNLTTVDQDHDGENRTDDTMTNNLPIENDFMGVDTVVKSKPEKNQFTLRKEIGGTKTEKRSSYYFNDRETLNQNGEHNMLEVNRVGKIIRPRYSHFEATEKGKNQDFNMLLRPPIEMQVRIAKKKPSHVESAKNPSIVPRGGSPLKLNLSQENNGFSERQNSLSRLASRESFTISKNENSTKNDEGSSDK